MGNWGMRAVLALVAVVGATLGVAPSSVAGPAAAEPPTQHCVLGVNADAPVCFDSVGDATAYEPTSVVAVTFYDAYYFGGDTLQIRVSKPCNVQTSPIEKWVPNLGTMDNRAGSMEAKYGCTVKFCDLVAYGNCAPGFERWEWRLGDIGWNNRISSVKIS